MLERAKEASRDGKYTYVEYARFADDLVILIDAYKRHDWLMAAVEKRLREELAELQVEINEEKSWIVDLGRGESFGFLGFDFRQVRSLRGAWRAHYTPKLKKRTALLRKLKDMFRRHQSQPVGRVVKLINPVLRGWVNYFAVGHSSECFSFVKDWVEKKIRRHMQRARNRQGFGWKRWSRQWMYNELAPVQGLLGCTTRAESRSGRIGPISLEAKQTGERSAGNPHAAFDAAEAGNVAWSRWCDTRRRKGEPTGNTNFDLNRRASLRPYRRGGRATKAPPDERGGNRHAQPDATAPHSDSPTSDVPGITRNTPCQSPMASLRATMAITLGDLCGPASLCQVFRERGPPHWREGDANLCRGSLVLAVYQTKTDKLPPFSFFENNTLNICIIRRFGRTNPIPRSCRVFLAFPRNFFLRH